MSPGVVGEMMRKLLGLADRVRAARDAKDLQHIRGCISRTLAAKVATALPACTGTLDITLGGVALEPGAEITVGNEYHQVKTTGPNVGLVSRLRDNVDLGA